MARVLIVNPFASGVSERRLAAVQAALPAGTETVLTQARGDATELAAEWSPRAEAIYVFSGDGTYNEVINGLRADIPVGFVPGRRHQRAAACSRPSARSHPRRRAHRARARRGGSRSAGSTAACSRSTPASGSTRSSSAASTRRAAGRTASGPATSRSAWTVVRALVDHRFRYEAALEVEGLGRAAFALIANCSPYTYAGSLGLRFVPGASFEGGLDIVAPIEVRPRAVPRLASPGVARTPGGRRRARRPRPRPDRDPLRRRRCRCRSTARTSATWRKRRSSPCVMR